jgi:hypothetical protein
VTAARTQLARLCGLLLAALALLDAPGARADDAQAAASAQVQKALNDQPKSEPQRSEAARPPGKLKVLRLDEFTVEGRIQKPQAFFILQRSNLNFDDGDKKESFLPKIVKTCEKDPF